MPKRRSKRGDETGLSWALPPVRTWFEDTFGTPTRAQREGWPAIASGQHTLICAPTGTGKTLAAFLAGLDLAWRASSSEGVKILYVSPLKALNADVAVNLEVPLLGIVREAERTGMPLRPLSVGVRTGDTSAAERSAQRKHPPDILITTPESLHLLLTSRQRETLRSVTHVIVDEIHELCSRKRGVSLAVLLERLSLLTARDCVRIGLSATLHPVEEVGAFLGGWNASGEESRSGRVAPRPVTIIDAGSAPALDLTVRSVNRSATSGERDDLDAQLLESIRQNRSTLIFANHRGEVERLTSRLNAQLAKDKAVSGTSSGSLVVRSHHGSLSLDQRRATEAGLKDGSLRAVVATASLELGIDVGTIDQVCQVGSPGSVARGLQRVGRSGHSVNEVSRARLFARTDSERLELVALADAMREGVVEPLRIPERCLDVLAQQILACVALESWGMQALYEFLKRAHPYRNLSWDEYEAVVAMLSGRSLRIDVRDLRPRIHWDRVSERLEALPGTRRLAVQGGNTIPETGQIPVMLDGAIRLGELDEDFVMERRAGDVIQLGTSRWVIRSIDTKRVLVAPAEGRSAIVPFWRGEGLGRSSLLGNRLGALRRRIAERWNDDAYGAWLGDQFLLDPELSQHLVTIIRRQVESVGHVPSDRTVLVESFLDETKCLNLLIQTPLGRRFHLGISLVVQGWSRERFGIVPVGNPSDDGVLMVFPGAVLSGRELFPELMTIDWKSFLIRELWDSPLFQVRFRQVLNRALPMVSAGTSTRAPLWFQRHRAESLFERLIEGREHPLIRETLRECLAEDLELAELESFFQHLAAGIVSVETVPMERELSPFASELLQQMAGRTRAQTRRPARRRRRYRNEPFLETESPAPLSFGPIDREAVERLESRLRGKTTPPRTAEEMAEFLRFCGDLDASECTQPMIPLLKELRDRGNALLIEIAGASPSLRWIATECLGLYEAAFEIECAGPIVEVPDDRSHSQLSSDEALIRIVQSWIRSHAVVSLEALAGWYGLSASRTRQIITGLVRSGALISVPGSGDDESEHWVERRNLEDLQRFTIALRRKESVCVDPETYAEALVRLHALDQAAPEGGHEVQESSLRRLACYPAPLDYWEVEVLQKRMTLSNPRLLDRFLRTEQWSWRCVEGPGDELEVALVPSDFAGPWTVGEFITLSSDSELVLSVLSGSERVETDDLLARCQLDAGRGCSALEELWKKGLIGGDHLDPVRGATRNSPSLVSKARGSRSARRSRGHREAVGTGRWESPGVSWVAFPPGLGAEGGEATGMERWVALLLDRYGVLCKETARLDRWAPSWSLLRAALDLAELRGEVRRGYFVAGLSGVQFASESFAESLRTSHQEDRRSSPVLISAMDPVNLYGPGAPFPFPEQEGKGIRFARTRSNHLVLMKGRPLIVSEHYARRLTVLPWADEDAIAEGLGLLGRLAGSGRRVLQVLEINGQPAMTSPFAEPLQRAGFVRNPPGLAFYAGWSDGPFA